MMDALSRRPLFMVLALALLVALVYGIWMVWQMQQLGANHVAASSSSAPIPQPVASLPAQASADDPAAKPSPAHEPVAASLPARMPTAEEAPSAEAKETAREETHEEADIVFARHVSTGESAPAPLQEAQAALARGDIEAARRQLADLSRADPYHLEVLLGLAAIALRQDDPKTAWRFYQEAWTAHPQDARVQAGMLVLRFAAGKIDPQGMESRLKTLIARQPQMAAPHFVLGNLFAGQARWPEAQAAYFEACRLEPGNPDYRFNLAVSLDALRQTRLAAAHYRAALVAAETTPASFSPTDVRARLDALQGLLVEEATP
jgi:Tfp pilus assembly protein PilF